MTKQEEKYSNTFMTVIRESAVLLISNKDEVDLPPPFDGFFLSKEEKDNKVPFKVFSAKELEIEAENNFFLYKIDL